jgi:hypothetical protein
MSYHEKKSIVSMISTSVIFVIYFFIVFQKYQAGNFDSTNVFSFWAAVILILIPITIAAKIVIYIAFVIIYRITTDENAPCFSDERDKLIELKADRNSHWLFCFGFLLAMASQVMHMTPAVMFIILILSGFVSDIFGEISQLYFYRKGI